MLADVDSRSSPDPLADEDWWTWLVAIVPEHCTAHFAAHHVEFWEWVWAIEPGERPVPFVGIWPRGGAKSTSAEAACVALGARRKRRYGWYVSGTQAQADQHVGNVAGMLESDLVELFYPDLATRAVGKYGDSKGWRHNRLSTAAGFTLDAVGLEQGARGVKVEEQRPDFLVIDDVDDTHDTLETTRKKIETITRKLIPAGSSDLAVVAIQNLVHPNSVFSRLADDRADFLARRHVSGPVPAVDGLETETTVDGGKVRHRIVAGTARWEGQNLETCQEQIDDWGIRAFRAEGQHEVDQIEGTQWRQAEIDTRRLRDVDPREIRKQLAVVVVGVDPAVTSGPDSDDTGIVVVGSSDWGRCPVCGPVTDTRHAFVLADRTAHVAPHAWGQAAVAVYDEFGGDWIVAEVNQGGDMVETTIRGVDPGVRFDDVRAGRGESKLARALPVAALYGDPDEPVTWQVGAVHHVGNFPELEEQMTTWRLGMDSPDRLDALVWALLYLDLRTEPRRMRYRGAA